MTDIEQNLKDLKDAYEMGGIDKAAYESQKKQLEEELASGNGWAGEQVSSESLPEDNLASTPLKIPKIHVSVEGKERGEFEREEIIKKIRACEIRRDAKVWKDGMPDWVAAGELPELENYFGPPPDTTVEDKRRKEQEAAKHKAEQEAALRKVRQEADAKVAKAEAAARAAQEKAAAEARARAEAEARTRAAQKAAEEEAKRRAQYTPAPPTPQYNRQSPSYTSYSGNGHPILFGIIGAVALGIVGYVLGNIIYMIIGGIIGGIFGKNIGDHSGIGSGILIMLFFIIGTALLTFTLSDFLTKHDNRWFGIFGLISPLLKILGFGFGASIIFALSFLIKGMISDNFIGKLILIAVLIAGGVFFGRPYIAPLFGKAQTVFETADANDNATATATITSDVNFRAGPSLDDEIIRQLQQDDTVTLTGETSGGWMQVTHNGDTGWVSSEYINISEVVK